MHTAAKVMGAALCIVTVMLLPALGAPAAHSRPIRVLMLHWYDRNYGAEEKLDATLHQLLQSSSPEGIEYYSEYLETNKFPGEKQSELLAQYLQQKYADRTLDVVVAGVKITLDFLLKNRAHLFPHTPIVFATDREIDIQRVSEAGATGFLFANVYGKTLKLAVKLHPSTERIFVISGTLDHDKSVESAVRNELQSDGIRVPITYLTDLSPDELRERVANLPKNSVIFYVWQQVLDRSGQLIESQGLLDRIAPSATAPIYGRSYANVGLGIVGGYVWTFNDYVTKLAETTLQVAHGARPQDISITTLQNVPMFDWRQLQRWGINEDRLPRGSIIEFRQLSMWQQYKWRIVGVAIVVALQALLIGALLVARRRSRRSQQELHQYKDRLEQLVEERTGELVEARDEAMAANLAKSVFLANMSHELRTPLNAILGFSSMILQDEALPDRHRKDLGVVEKSGEHLLTLIDDVLDMAKIESGRVVVENASTDLHRLVTETINMLRERARVKNLELLSDISPRVPPFVRTDPGKLRQVLTNLIGNALKYTDVGSVVVRVDAAPQEDSQQVNLGFDIEDTGIGIAGEDQARIFEPFVQAAGRKAQHGTGLGLAISRRFVEAQGGRICVESTLGRGSRFRVELPALIVAAADVTAGSPSVEQVIGLAAGQPEHRVLIVEDHRENWLLMRRLLEGVGFQVRIAEDGGQAVEDFRNWRPHFIWMDVVVPVLSGMEATRRIRQLEGGSEVKIAAVTASVFGSQREEVLAAGFDDFLRKPYRPNDIFDCMARHLGVRYVYGPDQGTRQEQDLEPVDVEDLAALAEAVRLDLECAVVSLDRDRILALIGRIAEQNARLAGALERLAHAFSYTSIFEALENCKNRLAAKS